MQKWIGVGTLLTVLWLFIRGVTPGHLIQELIIGSGVGFMTAYGLRRMYPGETDIGHWIDVAPTIAGYAANFAKELMLANFDVAKRVMLPSMPIEPGVIEIPLRLEHPAAVTILANSITLTPGTLTMDYNKNKNALYVHGMTGKDRRAVLEPIRHWEDLLIKIFNEDSNGERQ